MGACLPTGVYTRWESSKPYIISPLSSKVTHTHKHVWSGPQTTSKDLWCLLSFKHSLNIIKLLMELICWHCCSNENTGKNYLQKRIKGWNCDETLSWHVHAHTDTREITSNEVWLMHSNTSFDDYTQHTLSHYSPTPMPSLTRTVQCCSQHALQKECWQGSASRESLRTTCRHTPHWRDWGAWNTSITNTSSNTKLHWCSINIKLFLNSEFCTKFLLKVSMLMTLLTVTVLQVLLGWTRASDISREELDLYL